MVMRRRSLARRAMPWLIAFALIGTVASIVHRASRMDDLEIVARAESVRLGRPLDGVPKDPTTALDILEPLLARSPEHFEGLLQAARAYADLRDFGKATVLLERAVEAAPTPAGKTTALRVAVSYFLQADLYDAAVETSIRIETLNAGQPLYELQTGVALYRGSVKSQDDVTRRLVSPSRTGTDVEVQNRIEAFVTDIWGNPDPEEFVSELVPDLQGEERATILQDIVAARARFQGASQRMESYGDFPGFDGDVSRHYVEMLLRSGRVYEASIEAAIALRQPNLQESMKRSFLEIEARCFELVDEHGHAADRYQAIVDWYDANDSWVPPRYLNSLLFERTRAGHWDWILANHKLNASRLRGEVVVDYAQAAALAATGDRDGARVAIRDPYAVVSLGALLPPSVRTDPQARRDVLMLAYELFVEIEDTRALSALDAILADSPHDHAARRLRVAELSRRGLLEGAREDAFALLTRDRRDQADYRLWLDTADELSRQRHGATLEERAQKFVSDEKEVRVAAVSAAFEAARYKRGTRTVAETLAQRFTAFVPREAALAYHITAARVDRHDFQQARIELRQLTEAYPSVQHFRYDLGRVLVREGKLDAASGEFLQLLDDVPSDTESLDLAMRIELALGRHEQAASLVNAMILRDPLGVGAVRYGHRLLQAGYPDVAQRLFERIVRLSDWEVGLDAKLMAARASVAQQDWAAADAWVAILNDQYPEQVEVAMLALQLGLAKGSASLVEASITALEPLAAGLFPDLMADLARTLVEGGLFEEILRIFDQEARVLPVARPALRPLAEAAKATGRYAEAESILARRGDRESIRDRFLLLALQRAPAEASRRLRLESVTPGFESERDLCIAAGNALTGFRALADPEPIAQLAAYGLDTELDPSALQLLDAVMRLLPALDDLDQVRPRSVIVSPRVTYPDAGRDVERLVALATSAPSEAREALEPLLLLLLCHERPFWSREARFLSELVLEHVPGLVVPSQLLAESLIAEGQSREAIDVLKIVLQSGELPIDTRTVELFMQASDDFGRAEWGVALAMAHAPTDPAAVLLADALAARGKTQEALAAYQAYLAVHPDDRRAILGSVRTLSALRRQGEAALLARQAVERRAEDPDLARACAEFLSALRRPEAEVVRTLELIHELWPDEHIVHEALARAYADDPERMRAILTDLIDRVGRQPVDIGSEAAAERTRVLMASAREARKAGHNDLARTLNELSLRLEPGAIIQFRELAFLELEEGNLDKARRYFEVITFVDQNDKEAALALARLLFERAGQPHVASDVIERAYQHNLPPQAVEIIAAEYFLRNDPQTALATFSKIAASPLLTPETFLSVGRIAYASGLDDAAAMAMFEQFLLTAPEDHHARPRADYLRALAAGQKPGAPKAETPERGKSKKGGKGKAAAPDESETAPVGDDGTSADETSADATSVDDAHPVAAAQAADG